MNRHRWVFPSAVFVTLLAVLLSWNIATPLFASPDEPAHLYKAYGVAHGQFVGVPIPDQPSNIRRFDVPESMGQPDVMCYFFRPNVPAGCATGSSSAGVSSAAVYPPLWYGMVGGGARLVGEADSQRVARGVAAALFAALIALAFAIARSSPRRSLAPLLLVGLTPMTLFLAGSVNPNGFEIAGFLLLWSLCLYVDDARAASARSGALIGGIAGVLLMSRIASAMWLAAGVAVMSLALGAQGLRRFLRWRFVAPAVGLTAVAAAGVVAWSIAAGFDADDQRVAADIGTSEVVRRSIERLPEALRQMIGVLGWLDTEIPWLAHVAFALITALLLTGVWRSRDRRLRRATAAVLVGLLVAPVVVNVASASSAGLVWQGRYAIPLYSMLGLLGTLGWDRVLRGDATSASTPAATASWLTRYSPLSRVRAVVAVCFVVAEVASFWQAMRRFTVGAHGKVWLTEPLGWRPPAPPMLLIAINAVLVTVFVAVVLRGTEPVRPAELAGGPSDHPAPAAGRLDFTPAE